jgi:hypothetical protein
MKLSTEQIESIRREAAGELPRGWYAAKGRELGVSRNYVWEIANNYQKPRDRAKPAKPPEFKPDSYAARIWAKALSVA